MCIDACAGSAVITQMQTPQSRRMYHVNPDFASREGKLDIRHVPRSISCQLGPAAASRVAHVTED
jgi:hypothetical protein